MKRFAGATLSEIDPQDVILDHIIHELLLAANQKPVDLTNFSNNSDQKDSDAIVTDIVENPEKDTMLKPILVLDQGNTSTCVASTAANICNLQNQITNSNPFFTYNCRSDQQKDNGMAVKNCLVVAYRYGIPTYDAYPVKTVSTSDDGNPHMVVKANTLPDAFKRRFKGYARVYSVQTAVDILALNKSSPFKNSFGGLFIVLPMRSDSYRYWDFSKLQKVLFANNNDDKIHDSKIVNELTLGYHCTSLIDFDTNLGVFKNQNSWGTNYANQGCTYFPFQDWNDFVAEVWFCTNNQEVANRIKSQVLKLNTYRNYGNGQLNANNSMNQVYNMTNLNTQLGYTNFVKTESQNINQNQNRSETQILNQNENKTNNNSTKGFGKFLKNVFSSKAKAK